jgi:hypothetical protein
MKPQSYTQTVLAVMATALLAAGSSYCYLRLNPGLFLIFDDSYITLKFAANLLELKAITFNGSDILIGATSPLHILLVALAGLWFKLELASILIGVTAFMGSSILVYLLADEICRDKKTAWLAGILMSTSSWMIFDALNGLETTTFIFLSLLTFYLFKKYRNDFCYIPVLVLCILTRPEGWFVAGSIWICYAFQFGLGRNDQLKRQVWVEIGLFFLLISPCFLINYFYTSSFWPSSAFSKMLFFAEGDFAWETKLNFLRRSFLLFFNTFLFPEAVLVLPLILFARRVIVLPFFWFYLLLFYGAYYFLFPGGIGHYWCRYQHIFIPLVLIAIASGYFEVLRICRMKVLKALVGLLLAAFILYNQYGSFSDVKRLYRKATKQTRDIPVELALWLKNNTAEDAVVAVHDIGTIGYFSGRKVLDLVGLTNKNVADYYWDSRTRKIFPLKEREVIEYLLAEKPDYLIMFPEWDRFFNLLAPVNKKYFSEIAAPVRAFPRGVKYTVYKCSWDFNIQGSLFDN